MAKLGVATERIATSTRAGTPAVPDPHAAVAAGALCDPPKARAPDTRLPLRGAVSREPRTYRSARRRTPRPTASGPSTSCARCRRTSPPTGSAPVATAWQAARSCSRGRMTTPGATPTTAIGAAASFGPPRSRRHRDEHGQAPARRQQAAALERSPSLRPAPYLRLAVDPRRSLDRLRRRAGRPHRRGVRSHLHPPVRRVPRR
jgi:hypothetical protein